MDLRTSTYRRTSRGKAILSTGAALFALTALLVTAGKADADNDSLVGYPSTAIYANHEFHWSFDSLGRALKANAIILSGLDYGFGPDKKGLLGRTEFGFDYILSAGGREPDVDIPKRLIWNFKTQLYDSNARGVRAVVGVYAYGSGDVGAPDIGYLMASKAYKWGKVQVGIAHAFGKKLFLTTPSGNADRTYFQLAFQRRIVGRLFGAFNFYTGNSTQSRFAPGMTYFFDKAYKSDIAVGVLHFNDSSVQPARNLIYLGFGYSFGGK
jgi:hypothetical protein